MKNNTLLYFHRVTNKCYIILVVLFLSQSSYFYLPTHSKIINNSLSIKIINKHIFCLVSTFVPEHSLTLNLLNFLKWNNPTSIFGDVQYNFRDIKMRTEKFVSQQYRGWLDCTDVQAGLTLYWWHRLITFGCSRIRVNNSAYALFQLF